MANSAKTLVSLMRIFAFAHAAPVENVYTLQGCCAHVKRAYRIVSKCTLVDEKRNQSKNNNIFNLYLLKCLNASTISWIFVSTFCYCVFEKVVIS